MALDFPANPSEGQTYIAENGVTYTYVCDPVGSTSCGWIANSQAGLDERYVNITGDNMTGDLTLGTDKITLDATDGNINAAGFIRAGGDSGTRVQLSDTGTITSAVESSGTTAFHVFTPDTSTANNKTFTITGDGSITTAGSGEFAGNVLVGGALPNAPNITLNADGYATFKQGYFTGGYGVSGGQASLSCTSGSGTIRAFEITNDIGADIVVFRYDGSTWLANGNINFSTSGSATFAGNVGAGNIVVSPSSAGSGVFIRPFGDPTKDNIALKENGSAEFAGTIECGGFPSTASRERGVGISPSGYLQVSNSDNTGVLFLGYKVGTQDAAVVLRNDGSAQFASGNGVSTNESCGITASGTIQIRNDSGNGDVFQIRNNSSSNVTMRLKASGSGNFAGPVQIGGDPFDTAGVEAGIKLNTESGNKILVATSVTGKALSVKTIGITGALAYILGNGEATFANTFFNLEVDDDTKYTTTTDADGNETRVYNGAVLDVKDRLQKTDAALTALKSAAAAAVDFAALKSAIATALADI